MKYFKILPFLVIAFLLSCDTVKNPVKENDGNTCGDETAPLPIRKILVEDFTGHKCPNCPQAAIKLQELINMYCDHIVPIGIHVGYFATPDDEFPADYRTTTGDELDAVYLVTNQGLPNGLINRSIYDGDYVIGRDNWAAAVNLLYDLTPDFNIIIVSEYNEETKEVTANLSVETYTQFDQDINLGLYVVEDSIVSPQKDGAQIIEDYVHRHVLRLGVNGTFGETIASSGQNGDIFEKSFTFSLSDEWNTDHIELVAFVSRKETNEIIQADSEHLDTE